MTLVNVVSPDGKIKTPSGGTWERCNNIKETGQFYKGIEQYWKCHKKVQHEGQHKDVRLNKVWDNAIENNNSTPK